MRCGSKQEEKVNFPILIDTPDNAVRNAYRGWSNGIFVVNKEGMLVFRSSWTHGPELAQVLYDLHIWERAQARNELVRVCYSERIVGLLRNKKISASVHRRAGSTSGSRFRAASRTQKEKSARPQCQWGLTIGFRANKIRDEVKVTANSKSEATLFAHCTR